MASLHEIAKLEGDILRIGEGWVIVWKTGRSWHSQSIFLDADGFFPSSVVELVQDILKQDPQAVMLNGIKCGGFWRSMKTADVELNIRWCYDRNLNLLKDSDAFPPEPEKTVDDRIQEEPAADAVMVLAVSYKIDRISSEHVSDFRDMAADQKRIIRIRGDPKGLIL